MFTHLEDPGSSVPESARKTPKVLIGTSEAAEAQVEELDVEIVRCARAKPVARRLMTIPGLDPAAAVCRARAGAVRVSR